MGDFTSFAENSTAVDKFLMNFFQGRDVSISLTFSLRFNSHFPGESGLAGVY